MTKFHYNGSVPTNVYYNNQVVNKVFYTDADGNNTEVWPLTPAAPTTSIGTTLTSVDVTSNRQMGGSGQPLMRIIVNFLENGFIEIKSQEGNAISGHSLNTTPTHSSSFGYANEPTKTLQEFRWTTSTASIFSGYQFSGWFGDSLSIPGCCINRMTSSS